jgi:hypothetical protein
MTLSEYLQKTEERYNPQLHLLGGEFKSPGYHSLVPNGTWVHYTRESFSYALDLLKEGSRANLTRACDILRSVIPLQDQDQASKTYGIWSWLYEEPLSKMSPPDWNWADFNGLSLAEIYVLHKKRLPADVRALILESLGHAAGSIFRRNMTPDYTNIAIMGGIVTSLAGEILGDERISSYGRRRLEKSVEHFQYHGGYNEYNSPTYTWVVAHDCERGLRILAGKDARRLVKTLWHSAWQTIAEHFHAPTGQLAGPQSRSYSTFLTARFVHWIATRTKTPLEPYLLPGAKVVTELDYTDPYYIPCPPSLRGHFRKVPASPYEIKRRFIRRATKSLSTWGTTWYSRNATLGSVNRDFSWDQRRGVQAYWVGSTGKPVSVRLRFLHDDREFASCYMFNQQVGPKVLSGLHLLLDRGDFHPFWGPAPDNVFQASDFRVRYEFSGEGLTLQTLPDGRFVVEAGKCRAYVTPAPAVFGATKVKWTATRGENTIGIDAILYHGRQKGIDFKTLFPVRIAAGLEIVESVAPQYVPLEWNRNPKGATVSWEGAARLEVTVPERAVPYTD